MFLKKKKNAELICTNDLVGCFGKLPVHMEFIKHHVNLPEIANLDQWYQNAYHYLTRLYGHDLKNKFLQMPCYHFSYFAAGRFPLLGTLMASQDQSGRAYPFVIFRVAEHPLAQEFPLLLLMLYQEFFSQSHWLCNVAINFSLSQVYEKINSLNQTSRKILKREVLEKSLTYLQNITFGDFWQILALLYPESNLQCFVETVIQQLAFFKLKVSKNEFIGIRLPLIVNNGTTDASVIFWLQLLNTLLAELSQYLQIFWNPGKRDLPNFLLIYFKPMPIKCFAQLFNKEHDDEHLIDIMSLMQRKNKVVINDFHIDLSASLLQTLQTWSKPGFLKNTGGI